MKEIKWKATWTNCAGEQQELLFFAPENKGIASIDFRLLLLHEGISIPPTYQLVEALFIASFFPRGGAR